MHVIAKNLSGTGLQIGIVLSRFNSDIDDGLLVPGVEELRRYLWL